LIKRFEQHFCHCHTQTGRRSTTGVSQKTCQINSIFSGAFEEKATKHLQQNGHLVSSCHVSYIPGAI
jgi:hypothetical protein